MPHLRSPSQAPAAALTLAVFLLLAGCFPHSCRRTESTALVPSDSLSRQIAESVPEDTLRLLWSSTGSDAHPLEFPRTVRFGTGGTVFSGDVERGSVFVFANGRLVREVPLDIEVPYLAGLAGDTLSIFSPASLGIYRIVGALKVDSTLLVDPERRETSLLYAAARDRIYYKRVDPEQPSLVLTFSLDGLTIDSTRLDGPHWRHAGLLKFWGDTLLSLSGFRPVVDLIPTAPGSQAGSWRRTESSVQADPGMPTDSTVPASASAVPTDRGLQTSDRPSGVDTLALVGFDSPMLARSRAFMLGDVHQPPMLSASAAAAGDLLFVMNMRPGWLQVDVFDRGGALLRRLVPPDQTYRDAFLPQDLDVRATQDGYEIVVALSSPEPRLQVFAWNPAE